MLLLLYLLAKMACFILEKIHILSGAKERMVNNVSLFHKKLHKVNYTNLCVKTTTKQSYLKEFFTRFYLFFWSVKMHSFLLLLFKMLGFP